MALPPQKTNYLRIIPKSNIVLVSLGVLKHFDAVTIGGQEWLL